MLHEDTYDKLLKYNTLLKIKPSQHFWFVTPHKKQSLVGVGGHVSDESVSFTKERFPLHTRDVLSFKGVKWSNILKKEENWFEYQTSRSSSVLSHESRPDPSAWSCDPLKEPDCDILWTSGRLALVPRCRWTLLAAFIWSHVGTCIHIKLSIKYIWTSYVKYFHARKGSDIQALSNCCHTKAQLHNPVL